MRSVMAVIIGILSAFVVGSVIGTQVVLASVQSMGLDVNLAMRWSPSPRWIETSGNVISGSAPMARAGQSRFSSSSRRSVTGIPVRTGR